MSTVKKSTAAGFRITGVDYASYLQMRASAGNRGYRMTYRDGVLWIMSPEFRHEQGAYRIGMIVMTYADATGLDYEPARATTFSKGQRRQQKGSGKEGDETFYLGADADKVRNKEKLDLAVDPPPSLWVEVDNRVESSTSFPVYADLGVPEIWRYRVRKRELWFGKLEGNVYRELAASEALSGLTPAIVIGLLDESEKQGTAVWGRWLREQWFPQNRALFPDFSDRQP